MNSFRGSVLIYLPSLLLLIVLSGCGIQSAVKNSLSQLSPADVLAQIEVPGQNKEGGFIHIQWVYEEAEGLSPNAHSPQFTQTINDVWVEKTSPWRFHLTTMMEPQGQILYDRGWDGTQSWDYIYSVDALHAVVNSPDTMDEPSVALDVSSLNMQNIDLLADAQNAGSNLRDEGVEEIKPWGSVRSIAYDWDGTTASTMRYAGLPHTIVFKVAVENNWLVEWIDIIHTDNGDIVHRHYRLTAWEEMASTQATADMWAISLPAGVNLVEELPEPTPVDKKVDAPTRTILRQEVMDFGWTPWLPTYLPEGASLAKVSVFPQWEDGFYHVVYEIKGNPSIVIDQAMGLTYGWGNDPEIIELNWATVELGPIDPLGPPGWVALIRPHQSTEEKIPNINLLVEFPDKDLILEMTESLQPITE
jgi:hypothetical protein